MNPFALGPTAVTFSNTPVAPAGTTTAVPDVVATEPVTVNFCETGDTNGPGKPTFTGSHVSRIRSGSIVITDDGTLDAALAMNMPPPPSDTAIAAPIAAQRLRVTLAVVGSS